MSSNSNLLFQLNQAKIKIGQSPINKKNLNPSPSYSSMVSPQICKNNKKINLLTPKKSENQKIKSNHNNHNNIRKEDWHEMLNNFINNQSIGASNITLKEKKMAIQ